MAEFAKRNFKVFFRDRAAVFFSLLSSIIIILLYVLFLGDVLSSGLDTLSNAKELTVNWLMAGLLAATSATAAMGSFEIYVSDRATGIYKDFWSSPIKRTKLVGGYVVSSFLVSLILTLITAIIAFGYIQLKGGGIADVSTLAASLAYIVLTTLLNTSMVFFIVSFFRSTKAFSAVSTVFGTLIGFLTGIYLPIGTLPEWIHWLIKLFPTSHGAALLRQAMMKPHYENIPAEALTEIKKELGITFFFGSYECEALQSILIMVGYTVLFFILAVINLSIESKRSES